MVESLPSLEYRTLGRTGEKISTIGMGTWQIGNYSGQEEREEQVKTIRRGIDLGINLIDTAEVYGRGRSEQLVAEAVRDHRDSLFIATKVSAEHLRREDVIAACDSSLKRLDVKQIDLYQVHWPNPQIPIEETMSGMEDLVRAGKIRYIGVSNFSVEQTEDARAALARSDLVSNQVEYSLTNRSVEQDLLPHCRREHITLIAYSPLARGAIPNLRIPAVLSRKYNLTPPQIMLNWVTRYDEVVAIPKAARIKHMEENAASVAVRFSESEYVSIAEAS
jgi:aryl-alcohol dehydrogenase-like predicted oxidoreductase